MTLDSAVLTRLARRASIVAWAAAALAAAFAMSAVEAVSLKLQGRSIGGVNDHFDWMVVHMAPAWMIFVVLLGAVRWLVRRWPLDDPPRTRSIVIHVSAALAFPAVHLLLLSALKVATREPMTLGFAFDLVTYYFVRGVVLYALAAALFHAIDASRRARVRAIAAAELHAALAQARLTTLRAQLSPHFLFNVLNSISMLVLAGDSDAALSALQQFSALLRGFLREPRELVSLREEIEFLEQYVELQRTRFGDRLNVATDVSDAIRDVRVPAFALYPLVENAFKHGIDPESSHAHVVVRARVAGDRVVLEVEDDGPGFGNRPDFAVAGFGVGLSNLRSRLATLYGTHASLTVVSRPARGVLARLDLPRHGPSIESGRVA